MNAMSFALALLVAAGAPTAAQAPPPQASAVGIARARIVAHRTKRLDGGETADFY